MYIPLVIQNADVDAKSTSYAHLKQDELLVTSEFYTIQGEGPWAGEATYFIRLAGCNYGSKENFCKGCDTRFNLDEGKVVKFETLITNVLVGFPKNYLSLTRKVVITGGEPLLQKNLVDFIHLCIENMYEVQVETNGSQILGMLNAKQAGAIVVCSPKASSKGYGSKSLITSEHVSCLKFVVSANPNDPHHKIPEWAFTKNVPIYVSPFTVYNVAYQGEVSSVWDATLVNQKLTRENYLYAAKLVTEDPRLRISVQLHTLLELA